MRSVSFEVLVCVVFCARDFVWPLPLASQFPVPRHSMGNKGIKHKPFVRIITVYSKEMHKDRCMKLEQR